MFEGHNFCEAAEKKTKLRGQKIIFHISDVPKDYLQANGGQAVSLSSCVFRGEWVQSRVSAFGLADSNGRGCGV